MPGKERKTSRDIRVRTRKLTETIDRVGRRHLRFTEPTASRHRNLDALPCRSLLASHGILQQDLDENQPNGLGLADQRICTLQSLHNQERSMLSAQYGVILLLLLVDSGTPINRVRPSVRGQNQTVFNGKVCHRQPPEAPLWRKLKNQQGSRRENCLRDGNQRTDHLSELEDHLRPIKGSLPPEAPYSRQQGQPAGNSHVANDSNDADNAGDPSMACI